MKQQTAVEFAFEELNKWRVETFGEFALIGIPQEVFDKAKALEQKQIETAFFDGDIFGSDYYDPENPNADVSTNYYNQKYKSDE
jgi:hypothetical protein